MNQWYINKQAFHVNPVMRTYFVFHNINICLDMEVAASEHAITARTSSALVVAAVACMAVGVSGVEPPELPTALLHSSTAACSRRHR